LYKILAKTSFKTNLVHYLPSCHSTNEIAQNLLVSGVEDGAVVITDDQFAGKGQSGNVWQSSPYNNLTFSLVLRPKALKPKEQFGITMAVSLAIIDVLSDYLPGELSIKWPNDIYFSGRKIAGMLIESNIKGQLAESLVIGIGLNVNQNDFNGLNATSIIKETGKKQNLNSILNKLYASIAERYDQSLGISKVALRKQYHRLLLGVNEERRFHDGEIFTGTILGTDPLGRLIIATKDGQRTFMNNEISYIFN
jgi:BirA family biotin operon repressor/biotin-[acetyl-CoA-carboxylase] ligase